MHRYRQSNIGREETWRACRYKSVDTRTMSIYVYIYVCVLQSPRPYICGGDLLTYFIPLSDNRKHNRIHLEFPETDDNGTNLFAITCNIFLYESTSPYLNAIYYLCIASTYNKLLSSCVHLMHNNNYVSILYKH